MNYRSNVPSPKKKLSGGKPVEKAVADSEEKRESPDVAAKLRERVGRLLATPAELVIVRRIWPRRFRVNVLHPIPKPGALKGGFAIARSFFIRTDEQGEIVRCEPLLPKEETPGSE
jgi:hypothetical protein